MTKNIWVLCSMLATATLVAAGCSSSSGTGDGGYDAAYDAAGTTLYALSTGDSCFDVADGGGRDRRM